MGLLKRKILTKKDLLDRIKDIEHRLSLLEESLEYYKKEEEKYQSFSDKVSELVARGDEIENE